MGTSDPKSTGALPSGQASPGCPQHAKIPIEICIASYFGNCANSEKCKKAHEVPSWLSVRFCISYLRTMTCCRNRKSPVVCNLPHRTGRQVAYEYKLEVERAKRGCAKCAEAAKKRNQQQQA